MAEATVQLLTTNLSGEEPFIGDLSEGEPFINVADGRIWGGDSFGAPVELGGAVINKPVGNLFTSNYLEVDASIPANLPISNTNPSIIPPGYYQEKRILLRFSQAPPSNFSTYFDYDVDWGNEVLWKGASDGLTWGGQIELFDTQATNPIDYYKAQGRAILIELSSFGPEISWIGRILWVNQTS